MRIIKRLIRSVSSWAHDEVIEKISVGYKTRESNDYLDGPCIQFGVYNASGGKVVQTYHYDMKADRSYKKLYVIHDDDDLGNEIGMIITRERLEG